MEKNQKEEGNGKNTASSASGGGGSIANTTSNKKPKQQHVRVGVGVLVATTTTTTTQKTDSSEGAAGATAAVFAGIRKGSHGAGSLALPGGHLEMYESWEDCAIREVKEEMNLDLDPSDVNFAHVTNDPMESEEKHYVTIFMMAKSVPGSVPENMEPDKCEGWKSYTWKELKDIHAKGGEPKLFGPLKRLVDDNPPSVENFLKSLIN